MDIVPWEIPDQELLATALRLERARNIKPANVGPIDMEKKTVNICGSDRIPYLVSLYNCECIDYMRRGLPCKHMIRLALELGLSLNIPVFDPSAAANYDVMEDITRLTDRWRSGQLTADALSKCVAALQSSALKAKQKK